MNRSGKRMLAVGAAFAVVLMNMGAAASAAEVGESEESVGEYAAAPKSKLSTAPLKSGETDRFFSLYGAGDKGVSPAVSDSIYRDGWQTLFSQSSEISEGTVSFTAAEGLVLKDADGRTISSGTTPLDLSDTLDVTLSAEDSSAYEGERQYHLNVVPQASGRAELYVISPRGRTINFNSYSGSEYDIVLFNRGTLPLEGVTAELIGAENVALDNAEGLKGITVEPYFGNEAASGLAVVNGQPTVKLISTGTEGRIKGTLRITDNSGAVLMDIPLSGYSGDPSIAGFDTEDAVKYVPYSDYIEIANGFDWLNAEITITGLDGSFTYDPVTRELYGVPQKAGRETFTASVRFVADDGTEIATKTKDYGFNVLENTNENVWNSTDRGYEVIKPIGTQLPGHDFLLQYHTLGFGGGRRGGSKTNFNNLTNGLPAASSYRTVLDGFSVTGGSAGYGYNITNEDGDILYSWVNANDSEDIVLGTYLEPDTVYYLNLESFPAGTVNDGSEDTWSTTDNISAASFMTDSEDRELNENGSYVIPPNEQAIRNSYISTKRIKTKTAAQLAAMNPNNTYTVVPQDRFLDDAYDVTDELFISKGEFAEFRKVWLNGRLLGSDEYTAVEGSTEITLSAQTMRNSAVQGVNTLAAEFRTTGTHSNELRVSAQNFRVELVSTGASAPSGSIGSGQITGGGSGVTSVTGSTSSNAPADTGSNTSDSVSAEGAGTAPAGDGQAAPVENTENAESGSKTNYVLAGVLMTAAVVALILTRKKQ